MEDIFHILKKHSFACSAINLLYLSHDALNNRAASGAARKGTERVTVFAGSNRKQECKYKILQIQPKFHKFLETCHSEKLQYLQGYTFYTLGSLVFKQVILQDMQLSEYNNSQDV